MVINNIKINYQLNMMFIKVDSQHQSSSEQTQLDVGVLMNINLMWNLIINMI